MLEDGLDDHGGHGEPLGPLLDRHVGARVAVVGLATVDPATRNRSHLPAVEQLIAPGRLHH